MFYLALCLQFLLIKGFSVTASINDVNIKLFFRVIQRELRIYDQPDLDSEFKNQLGRWICDQMDLCHNPIWQKVRLSEMLTARINVMTDEWNHFKTSGYRDANAKKAFLEMIKRISELVNPGSSTQDGSLPDPVLLYEIIKQICGFVDKRCFGQSRNGINWLDTWIRHHVEPLYASADVPSEPIATKRHETLNKIISVWKLFSDHYSPDTAFSTIGRLLALPLKVAQTAVAKLQQFEAQKQANRLIEGVCEGSAFSPVLPRIAAPQVTADSLFVEQIALSFIRKDFLFQEVGNTMQAEIISKYPAITPENSERLFELSRRYADSVTADSRVFIALWIKIEASAMKFIGIGAPDLAGDRLSLQWINQDLLFSHIWNNVKTKSLISGKLETTSLEELAELFEQTKLYATTLSADKRAASDLDAHIRNIGFEDEQGLADEPDSKRSRQN